MKFLYTTDLHGDPHKYETVLAYAIEHGYTLIHLGADLLPKGSGLYNIQKKFVRGYLKEWHNRAQEKGILVLSFFGNDDLYPLKEDHRSRIGSLLDDCRYIDADSGWTYKAYGWVPVHPFGLLNGCKLDNNNSLAMLPTFYNRPADMLHRGVIETIPNWQDHLLRRGTIEEDMKNLTADEKTVMAIHGPPVNMGLDICADGRQVGSKSIRDWIERTAPGLVLCGHIHESPWRSEVWKSRAHNGTMVIQPGQHQEYTVLVEVDLDDLDNSKRVVIP